MNQNRIFEHLINHVIIKSSNMCFWSSFYCSNGPSAASTTSPFSNNLKVDQNRLSPWRFYVIIIFEDKTNWTKNALSKQFLHVIWTPWNIFRDEKIKPYVVGLVMLYSWTGRSTKLGMSLTGNEPSQAIFMLTLTSVCQSSTKVSRNEKNILHCSYNVLN